MIFVLAVLAAYSCFGMLAGLLPFVIPSRLTPLVVAGLAYGVLSIPDKRVVYALAATTVVMLMYGTAAKLLGARAPRPWNWRYVVPRPHRINREDVDRQFRPGPSSQPGSRIPTLPGEK